MEIEVPQEEVFEGAASPYGFPVIAFSPNGVDSKIYMTPWHNKLTRKLLATFSWLCRKEGFLFLTQRRPESFLEWGYCKYYTVPDGKEVYRIDLSGPDGYPVTYFEV